MCTDQFARHHDFLAGRGYVPRGRDEGTRTSVFRWERVHADTTDVIGVEFVTSIEGSGGTGVGPGRYVLRIHVSGQRSVGRDGERRAVRDAGRLRQDVDAVVKHLQSLFEEIRQRE